MQWYVNEYFYNNTLTFSRDDNKHSVPFFWVFGNRQQWGCGRVWSSGGTKLQNRIFKRIFSSKGANFPARFASIFHFCPPGPAPWNISCPHFPPKKSGAGAATGGVEEEDGRLWQVTHVWNLFTKLVWIGLCEMGMYSLYIMVHCKL